MLQTSLRAGLLLLLILGLTACQTPHQTRQLLEQPPEIVRQKLIKDVPFYPQEEFFCGPTTLSEVANFYGINKTPTEIAPNTFTPNLEGTLQIEMASATRQMGLVAYQQHRANMQQLLHLVADNIPIIVLQNNSIEMFPRWHYAVVIGYDLNEGEVILHTGVTENHRLNFATFERTWQRANYWLLAMLPSDVTSEHLDPFLYTKASQDLISTGQSESGIRALTSATKQWPDYWLPYFLLGNHYYSLLPEQSAYWFEKGLPLAEQQLPYLNNYAMLLSQLGCHNRASSLITQALALDPDDENLIDSQQQIALARGAAEAENEPQACTIATQ